jgi:AraC family transcriptional regulator
MVSSNRFANTLSATASGMKAADAPSFGRYDEKFDPATGDDRLEIWIPVRE